MIRVDESLHFGRDAEDALHVGRGVARLLNIGAVDGWLHAGGGDIVA